MHRIDAARLVLWGNAVATGHVPPDAMTDAVGPTRWIDGGDSAMALPVALAQRRRVAPVRLRLVLPVSGDAGALRAPTATLSAAVNGGAGIVVEPLEPQPHDQCLLLVPGQPHDVTGPQGGGVIVLLEHALAEPVTGQADVATCARELAQAIAEAEHALAALDVGQGRAQADVELRRQEKELAAPPAGADPRAQQLLHRALAVLSAVDIAQQVESRAVSATELRLRSESLNELSRAARRALEASVGPAWAGPPSGRGGR